MAIAFGGISAKTALQLMQGGDASGCTAPVAADAPGMARHIGCGTMSVQGKSWSLWICGTVMPGAKIHLAGHWAGVWQWRVLEQNQALIGQRILDCEDITTKTQRLRGRDTSFERAGEIVVTISAVGEFNTVDMGVMAGQNQALTEVGIFIADGSWPLRFHATDHV